MILLALDTALGACSAAVLRDGELLAVRSEPMERGHQERLAPMIAEAMRESGLGFPALDRLAVTVGPGSFTGVRVGLAFAKGLALALDRPCLGVGTLEALAASAPSAFVAAAIDARRDRVYLQAFADGVPAMAPDLLDLAEAAARLAELYRGGDAQLIGSGAGLIAGAMPGAAVSAGAAPDIAALARLAARRPPPTALPRPLYLRPPDALTIAERQAGR
jgi:tRNA threonylcarbamoyladenosine biosynthesis protein TsaB